MTKRLTLAQANLSCEKICKLFREFFILEKEDFKSVEQLRISVLITQNCFDFFVINDRKTVSKNIKIQIFFVVYEKIALFWYCVVNCVVQDKFWILRTNIIQRKMIVRLQLV